MSVPGTSLVCSVSASSLFVFYSVIKSFLISTCIHSVALIYKSLEMLLSVGKTSIPKYLVLVLHKTFPVVQWLLQRSNDGRFIIKCHMDYGETNHVAKFDTIQHCWNDQMNSQENILWHWIKGPIWAYLPLLLAVCNAKHALYKIRDSYC